MKVINVKLTVKPGLEKEYEDFIDKLVQGSLSEDGNIAYGHFKKIGTDDQYEIIEHWKDAEAVESHNNTTHFKNFLDHIGDYVTKDPEIIRMDN